MIELLIFIFEFFKTGLFAIGGGLATLPFLYDMTSNYDWFTMADVADMVAISESTPGPIGVNMATYVGYTSFGLSGALLGPLGLVTPSVIIIIIVSKFLKKFKDSKVVKSVFYGLRPASTGLVIAAGLGVLKLAMLNTELLGATTDMLALVDWKSILLAIGIFVLMKVKKDIHPILVIVIAAVIGVVFQF